MNEPVAVAGRAPVSPSNAASTLWLGSLGLLILDEMRNLITEDTGKAQARKLERELQSLMKKHGADRMPIDEGITNVLPKY